MNEPMPRRITRELTDDEKERLRRQREQISAELPDLIERDLERRAARSEATLSGELRRAVHASPLSLSAIAEQVGITPLALDQFLTGEHTLPSDVLDRLARILGYVLQPSTS